MGCWCIMMVMHEFSEFFVKWGGGAKVGRERVNLCELHFIFIRVRGGREIIFPDDTL